MKQPQNPAIIDYGNPITRGLVLATPYPASKWDACRPSAAITGTANRSFSGGLMTGFGATYGAASTDKMVSTLTSHATQRTYYMRAWRNGTGGGSLGRLIDKRNSGGTEVEYLLWYDDLPRLQYYRVWSTGTAEWHYDSAIPSQSVVDIVLSYDSSAPTNDPSLYINGALVAPTNEVNSAAGSATNNTDAYHFGNRGDGTRNWPGYIGPVMVWDRLLSADEARSISVDPYQVFAEPVPFQWYWAAQSSTAPVLSAPGVQSITATTAVPKVTLTFS